jgi:leader peptidase (prepilin peptidase) / N-methyltransferase
LNPEAAALIAVAAVFGLILGSFLNVCIYRLPLGLTPWRPVRSFCPFCEASIAWYDNIPLLSFLLLRGRCRNCGSSIPFRYPLVELSLALAFAVIVTRWGFSLEALKWCLLASLLVSLFWTDIENRFLPDELTVGGAVAGVSLATFLPPVSLIPGILINGIAQDAGSKTQSLIAALGSALLLSIPLLLIGWLYSKVRGKKGLGFGDVKLLLLIGAFFGVERGVRVLLVACLGGLVIGLTYIRLRRLDPQSYGLPLGSFIAAGGLLALLGAF